MELQLKVAYQHIYEQQQREAEAMRCTRNHSQTDAVTLHTLANHAVNYNSAYLGMQQHIQLRQQQHGTGEWKFNF